MNELRAYRASVFGALTLALLNSDFSSTDLAFWRPIGVLSFLSTAPDVDIVRSVGYLGAGAGVLAMAGLAYPWTALIAFGSALLKFTAMSSFGEVSNALQLITLTAGLLCLARDRADRWVLRICRYYVVWVYFSAGLGKLVFGSWRWAFSENFYLLTATRSERGPLGEWMLSQPLFVSIVMATGSLAFELMAPLALTGRRAGLVFFAAVVAFHVGVTAMFGGHYFFYTQIAAASIFLWSAILRTRPSSYAGD